MVGAGVKERGGTALVYKAEALRGGEWAMRRVEWAQRAPCSGEKKGPRDEGRCEAKPGDGVRVVRPADAARPASMYARSQSLRVPPIMAPSVDPWRALRSKPLAPLPALRF